MSDFVGQHRHWAPAIVLLLAFAETCAGLSILIPSTAILVALGAMIAADALEFLPIWIAASVGALAGSTLSYWLGLRYGGRIFRIWPMSRDPRFEAHAAAAFGRWGAAAVLVGHFVGPLRAVVFLAAGASRMPGLVFQAFNLPACLIWAYVVPKSGEWGGHALGALWSRLFGT